MGEDNEVNIVEPVYNSDKNKITAKSVILTHWRNDDAIGKFQLAERKRREKLGGCHERVPEMNDGKNVAG